MSNTQVAASTHLRQYETSYNNLQAAREERKEQDGYDSAADRQVMKDAFLEKFGSPAQDWQLDVAEALCLRLNSIVISGTGTGKTFPYALPLMRNKKAKALILSPLKVLQADQVARFRALGIRSAAVNGDTWKPKLQRKLEDGKIQAIFTSPEMCLQHPAFRTYLSNALVAEDITMVVIDEAHCISQWGGDFRKTYGELERLRAFLPTHVPFLATTATLTPPALRDVQNHLGIELDKAFFLNRGNDRPNITVSIQHVKSPTDFDAILPLLSNTNKTPLAREHLRKSIVFVNSVTSAQALAKHIKEQLPEHLKGYVDVLHAQRTPRAKRRVMRQLRDGETLVLIATEAAGMGADIPDIEQVIQLGVPSSLSVWIQRAGRAGRDKGIQARAILLVEPSVFEKVKRGSAEGEGGEGEDQGEDEGSSRDEDVEYRKKVEPALRLWIEAKGCRRDVVDGYFGNPARIEDPTGDCCDICVSGPPEDPPLPAPMSRAPSPDAQETETPPGSAPGSPNPNGKRPMLPPPVQQVPEDLTAPAVPPKPKRKKRYTDDLKEAKANLITWRFATKARYFTPSSFIAAVIFPDRLLNSLANTRDITSLEDLEECAHMPWGLGRWKPTASGDDVGDQEMLFERAFEVVQALDREKERVKQQKKAASDAAAAEKERERLQRAEAKRLKDLEAQRKRDMREAEAWLKEREAERKGFRSFDSSSPALPPPTGAPMVFQYNFAVTLPREPVVAATPTPASRQSSKRAKENIRPPETPSTSSHISKRPRRNAAEKAKEKTTLAFMDPSHSSPARSPTPTVPKRRPVPKPKPKKPKGHTTATPLPTLVLRLPPPSQSVAIGPPSASLEPSPVLEGPLDPPAPLQSSELPPSEPQSSLCDRSNALPLSQLSSVSENMTF